MGIVRDFGAAGSIEFPDDLGEQEVDAIVAERGPELRQRLIQRLQRQNEEETRLDEELAFRQGETPLMENIGGVVAQAPKAAGRMLGKALEYGGRLNVGVGAYGTEDLGYDDGGFREAIRADIPGAIEQDPATQSGRAITAAAEQTFDAPEAVAESIPGQISAGAGSVLGMLPAAALGGPVAAGAMYGLSAAQETVDDVSRVYDPQILAAKTLGDTARAAELEREKFRAQNIAGPIAGVTGAATEATLGVAGKLARGKLGGIGEIVASKLTKPGVTGRLGRAAAGAAGGFATEALQEGSEQALNNATARIVYDGERDLMDGVAESVALGGVVGAKFGALSGATRKAQDPLPASRQAAEGKVAEAEAVADEEAELTEADIEAMRREMEEPVVEAAPAVEPAPTEEIETPIPADVGEGAPVVTETVLPEVVEETAAPTPTRVAIDDLDAIDAVVGAPVPTPEPAATPEPVPTPAPTPTPQLTPEVSEAAVPEPVTMNVGQAVEGLRQSRRQAESRFPAGEREQIAEQFGMPASLMERLRQARTEDVRPKPPVDNKRYETSVRLGDVDSAQQMVDEAAEAAGFKQTMFHGTRGKWTKWAKDIAGGLINLGTQDVAEMYSNAAGGLRGRGSDASFLEENGDRWDPVPAKGVDQKYGRLDYKNNNTGKIESAEAIGKRYNEGFLRGVLPDARTMRLRVKLQNPLDLTTEEGVRVLGSVDAESNLGKEIVNDAKKGRFSWSRTKYEGVWKVWLNDLGPKLKALGYDGLNFNDEGHRTTAVFDGNQIKSADPVVYDDAGNIIPLDRRFAASSDDIRGAVAPRDSRVREATETGLSEIPDTTAETTEVDRAVMGREAQPSQKPDQALPEIQKRRKHSGAVVLEVTFPKDAEGFEATFDLEYSRQPNGKYYSGGIGGSGGAPQGTGILTEMYIRALQDAQRDKMGWQSEAILGEKPERVYRRLQEAGVPFVWNQEENQFQISGKELKKVDLNRVRERLAEKYKKKALDRAVMGRESAKGEAAEAKPAKEPLPDAERLRRLQSIENKANRRGYEPLTDQEVAELVASGDLEAKGKRKGKFTEQGRRAFNDLSREAKRQNLIEGDRLEAEREARFLEERQREIDIQQKQDEAEFSKEGKLTRQQRVDMSELQDVQRQRGRLGELNAARLQWLESKSTPTPLSAAVTELKDAIKGMQTLGIRPDPAREMRVYRALYNLAKELIATGVRSVAEFVKRTGKKPTAALTRAFEDALSETEAQTVEDLTPEQRASIREEFRDNAVNHKQLLQAAVGPALTRGITRKARDTWTNTRQLKAAQDAAVEFYRSKAKGKPLPGVEDVIRQYVYNEPDIQEEADTGRKETEGYFTGQVVRESDEKWSSEAEKFIADSGGAKEAYSKALALGDVPLQQYVLTDILKYYTEQWQAQRNPVEMWEANEMMDKITESLKTIRSDAGKALIAARLNKQEMRAFAPVLSLLGLIRSRQKSELPFPELQSEQLREWLQGSRAEAIKETIKDTKRADAVVAREFKEVAKNLKINWGELLTQALKHQETMQKAIAREIMKNPALKGLSVKASVELSGLLAKQWQAERNKVLRREFGRVVGLPKVREQDLEKVMASLPRIIRLANLGILTNDAFRDAIAPEFGVASIEGSAVQEITDLAQKAQEVGGVRQNELIQEMYRLMQKTGGVLKRDILRDYWYASVLSGTRTFFDSFMNVLNGALVSGMMAGTAAGVAGKRGGVKAGINAAALVGREWRKGTSQAVKDFWPILTAGELWRNDSSFNQERAGNSLEGLALSENIFAKLISSAKYVGRLNTALDHFAGLGSGKAAFALGIINDGDPAAVERYFNPTEQAWEIAKARAVNEGTKPDLIERRAWEIIRETANPSVIMSEREIQKDVNFQNEPKGVLGIVYRMITAMDKEYTGARFLTGLGFIRFALNMTNTILNYAPPVALARYVMSDPADNTVKKMVARMTGKTGSIEYNREQRQILLAQAMLSTALATFTAALFLGDDDEPEDRFIDITGSFKSLDYRKKSQLLSQGLRPYSIKVGDKYISYRQMGFGGLLATIGELRDRQVYNRKVWDQETILQKFTDASAAGLMIIGDSPAISSFTSFLGFANAYKYDVDEVTGKSLPRYVSRLAGSMIPNILKEVDAWFDPSIYKAEPGNLGAEYFLQQVPYLRRDVGPGPMLNILGEPVKVERLPLSRWLAQREDDPAWRTLATLSSRGVFLSPPAPNTTVIVGGKRQEMTREEKYRYQREVGAGYRKLIETDGAKVLKMTPEDAAEYLTKRTEKIRADVQQKMSRKR